MSFDSNILNGTEPKFVAAIAQATEPYILSNHGGMVVATTASIQVLTTPMVR